MSNLIWKKFVSIMLPSWLEWLANHSVEAHVGLVQRFILSHPYYIPPSKFRNFTPEDDDIYDLMNQLFIGKDFLESLTDKGAEVWYHSSFEDFVEELRQLEGRFTDIKLFIRLYDKFSWWFERVYAYIREDIASYLISQGRTFK
tara:strand:+ start:222 stop:653 length:432 start_codon:yes stop_codon:yes gene_type:complete